MSKYASTGTLKCETTSLRCVVEGLPDGTEHIVTVVPSYDLGWEVTGGNVIK